MSNNNNNNIQDDNLRNSNNNKKFKINLKSKSGGSFIIKSDEHSNLDLNSPKQLLFNEIPPQQIIINDIIVDDDQVDDSEKNGDYQELLEQEIQNENNNNNNNIIINLKDSNNIELDYVDLNNNSNNDTNSNGQGGSILSFKFLKTVLLVFMISNLGYSTFFSYTSAESLSHTFYKTFSINSNQFGSLFTLYAIPNVFMVFLSGVIVDVIGADKVSIVLSCVVVTSTLIGVLSVPNYNVMLLSRFLLGFAGESLIACSNTIMSKWFSSKKLSICIGVLVGWIYSANFVSLSILPIINKYYGFNTSLWALFFVALFGLSLNLFYILVKNKLFNDIATSFKQDTDDQNLNLLSNDFVKIQDELLDEQQQTNDTTDRSNKNENVMVMIVGKVKDGVGKVKSILIQVPIRMWIYVGIVFFGYTALFGLAIIGPDFLGQKYGFDEQKAALILSSEHVCSALFSPVCGVLIKKFSKRITILLISMILMIIGLTCLVATDVFPLPWIIICGVGYSMLNTTIISTLPIFIPQSIMGTCYGFVGTSYNCGLIVFPYILGSLKESTGNYNLSLIVLIGNCAVSILLLGLLKYYDLKSIPSQRLDI